MTADGKDLADIIGQAVLSGIQTSIGTLGLKRGPLVVNSRAANASAGGTMAFKPTIPSLLVAMGHTGLDWVSSIVYSDGTQCSFSRDQSVLALGAFITPEDTVYVTTPRAVSAHNVVVVFQPISIVS